MKNYSEKLRSLAEDYAHWFLFAARDLNKKLKRKIFYGRDGQPAFTLYTG
ncbi:MAG: hypothetical protein ACYCPQ_05365 [Elusimicrobiota bacterium]